MQLSVVLCVSVNFDAPAWTSQCDGAAVILRLRREEICHCRRKCGSKSVRLLSNKQPVNLKNSHLKPAVTHLRPSGALFLPAHLFRLCWWRVRDAFVRTDHVFSLMCFFTLADAFPSAVFDTFILWAPSSCKHVTRFMCLVQRLKLWSVKRLDPISAVNSLHFLSVI